MHRDIYTDSIITRSQGAQENICIITDRDIYTDSIITRSLGPQDKICLLKDHDIYTRPLFKLIKIVNATSLPGFQIHNKCPTHRHLVWDISQCIQFYSYNTQHIYKSRYEMVYVDKIIEHSKNSNSASASQQTSMNHLKYH